MPLVWRDSRIVGSGVMKRSILRNILNLPAACAKAATTPGQDCWQRSNAGVTQGAEDLESTYVAGEMVDDEGYYQGIYVGCTSKRDADTRQAAPTSLLHQPSATAPRAEPETSDCTFDEDSIDEDEGRLKVAVATDAATRCDDDIPVGRIEMAPNGRHLFFADASVVFNGDQPTVGQQSARETAVEVSTSRGAVEERSTVLSQCTVEAPAGSDAMNSERLYGYSNADDDSDTLVKVRELMKEKPASANSRGRFPDAAMDVSISDAQRCTLPNRLESRSLASASVDRTCSIAAISRHGVNTCMSDSFASESPQIVSNPRLASLAAAQCNNRMRNQAIPSQQIGRKNACNEAVAPVALARGFVHDANLPHEQVDSGCRATTSDDIVAARSVNSGDTTCSTATDHVRDFAVRQARNMTSLTKRSPVKRVIVSPRRVTMRYVDARSVRAARASCYVASPRKAAIRKLETKTAQRHAHRQTVADSPRRISKKRLGSRGTPCRERTYGRAPLQRRERSRSGKSRRCLSLQAARCRHCCCCCCRKMQATACGYGEERHGSRKVSAWRDDFCSDEDDAEEEEVEDEEEGESFSSLQAHVNELSLYGASDGSDYSTDSESETAPPGRCACKSSPQRLQYARFRVKTTQQARVHKLASHAMLRRSNRQRVPSQRYDARPTHDIEWLSQAGGRLADPCWDELKSEVRYCGGNAREASAAADVQPVDRQVSMHGMWHNQRSGSSSNSSSRNDLQLQNPSPLRHRRGRREEKEKQREGYQGKVGRGQQRSHSVSRRDIPDRGQLQLGIGAHFGMLSVTVAQAKGLQPKGRRPPNTFIKVSLVPDTEKRTFCTTDAVTSSYAPHFNQQFSFELLEEDRKKRLLISVWNQHLSSSEFLGCMSFGVKHLLDSTKEVNGWFHLLREDLGKAKHLNAVSGSSKRYIAAGIEAE
ncbi:PREDICTED: uncharacterized protein LOC106817647 isoform X2 [Priapulus caudatus]|uniref:Uncharacterized protein LOC106817647 isoform X2 n=1 Tax=Priapulus caudatus TaxID=37621 RepID=A0ABM1F049_PRICU|nr:PREDICTED: uncharacterized protein LOC106817647 isoform X2 [Priapulus caudatus]